MKTNILAIFFVVLVLSSCATKKKVVETFYQTMTDSIVASEKTTSSSTTVIDTTKIMQGMITITHVDFFAPDTDVVADTHAVVDNVGTFANVKSIRQTTIDLSKEERGEIFELIATEEERDISQVLIQETEKTKDKTTRRFDVIVILLFVVLLFIASMVVHKLVNHFKGG